MEIRSSFTIPEVPMIIVCKKCGRKLLEIPPSSNENVLETTCYDCAEKIRQQEEYYNANIALLQMDAQGILLDTLDLEVLRALEGFDYD
jgi:hypothetical protein